MIKSFVRPFVLTTTVSNFILLIQYLLKYFDDFVGKNLGVSVFAELLFYFSLNMLQVALPLGVLVASLMTFGNLGENFELTAIKGSGISLLRTLRPIFFFVLLLSFVAFFFNNYAIPAANLKAYSLLYDIKQTKPALDIKAGSFYNGIPNFSIKAKDKLPDGKTLLDVIIYDHSQEKGNKTVILADSALMYAILDDRYLKLELYDGNYYSERPKKRSAVDQFYRTKYHKMEMVFSLASFDLRRRKEELFRNNRQMKNIDELTQDIDSFEVLKGKAKRGLIEAINRGFIYHLRGNDLIMIEKDETDTMQMFYREKYLKSSLLPATLLLQLLPKPKSKTQGLEETLISGEDFGPPPFQMDSMFLKQYDNLSIPHTKDLKKPRAKKISKSPSGDYRSDAQEKLLLDTIGWEFLHKKIDDRKLKKKAIVTSALTQARNVKVNAQSAESKVYKSQKNKNLYTIEKYKKYAQALACLIMFMIGAPLGAIIKKGGLGVPTIVAIFFFIVYYVFTSVGEKSAKEGAMDPYLAVWLSDIVLLPFGLFFLYQARMDSRFFEWDSYLRPLIKIQNKFKQLASRQANQ